MTEPKSFTAGETVSWKVYSDKFHPADGWELSYHLRGSSYGAIIEIAAIPEDSNHSVYLSADETITYQPGIYWWQCFARSGDDQHLVASGQIEVKANLATLEHYDGRSHVKKVLDAIEYTILGKASRDQLSYSIAGRSLSRMNPSELLEWRDKYKAEYVQLQRKSGTLKDQIIKVRFTST